MPRRSGSRWPKTRWPSSRRRPGARTTRRSRSTRTPKTFFFVFFSSFSHSFIRVGRDLLMCLQSLAVDVFDVPEMLVCFFFLAPLFGGCSFSFLFLHFKKRKGRESPKQ